MNSVCLTHKSVLLQRGLWLIGVIELMVNWPVVPRRQGFLHLWSSAYIKSNSPYSRWGGAWPLVPLFVHCSWMSLKSSRVERLGWSILHKGTVEGGAPFRYYPIKDLLRIKKEQEQVCAPSLPACPTPAISARGSSCSLGMTQALLVTLWPWNTPQASSSLWLPGLSAKAWGHWESPTLCNCLIIMSM